MADRGGQTATLSRRFFRLLEDNLFRGELAAAPTGEAQPPLVSTSAMDESDHAQCVSVTWVPTPFGDVSLPAKPSMLCSFGLKFTDWVRDVAAPLTLAYTGQKLAEIETSDPATWHFTPSPTTVKGKSCYGRCSLRQQF